MSIGKTGGVGRTASVAGTYVPRQKPAADAVSVAPITPVAAASVLGIPEAEFTPRVRDAIMGLMSEVDRLRREVEQTRTRLEELARTADQDMLLPILNRRAFVREITRFVALAERYSVPSCVLYFDLDNFKEVNDVHGHAAGDAVLRHFCDLISHQIRENDVFARIGGDEFGVILSHTGIEQAAKKGASLAQSLTDHPAVWENQPVEISFSYGAYELHAGENPDTAIKEADRAMYVQKRRGPDAIKR
jgi:diguanylate cyclase (GGDEF)-like protein